MRFTLISILDGRTKTENLVCHHEEAERRFCKCLFDEQPDRIELWKRNRRGELCELLYACGMVGADPEATKLSQTVDWGPVEELECGVGVRYGGTVWK